MAETTKKTLTCSLNLCVDARSSLGARGQLHHYLNQVDRGEALRPFFSKHNQTNIHHSKKPFPPAHDSQRRCFDDTPSHDAR